MKTLTENLGSEWAGVLGACFEQPFMNSIAHRIILQGDNLRPSIDNVFAAYRSTPPSKIKVVIIGQDPYPGNEAHGLSFSSQMKKVPPSLKVIFNELEQSMVGKRTDPNLQDWADQGVFLLNSILTTTYRAAAAHKNWGWQSFTGMTLRYVQSLAQPVVYMAWGGYAQNLLEMNQIVNQQDKLILTACHPQAENYPGGKKFTGCGHFNKANAWLEVRDVEPIKWV